MALPTTANVSRPQALGYGCRINDTYYRLAASPNQPLDIQTAPLEAPRLNTLAYAVSAGEEFHNDFGEFFSRTSFIGGEGLAEAHRRDAQASDPTRFWDSNHIDISDPTPGVPSTLTLCPPTANVDSTANTVLPLAFDGAAIYMGSGNVTRRAANYTAASPTFADSDPGASAVVLDLTNLGSDVYAAITGAAIYARKAGSWASLGAGSIHALKVWGLKRQLLGSTGTVLQTVNTTTGASVTTLATLQTGESWLDAADCGAAIIACATDGNLYVFGNNASAVLELKTQSLVGPTEVPYCVGWNGTQVFYKTREATASGAIGRFYRAEFDPSSFTLGNAQLLRQFGDSSTTIDQCARKIIATRDSVMFAVYETAASYVWRYDNVSGGLVRYLDLGTTGLVHDLLAVGSRVFAGVQGYGLRREKVGFYETSGYLIGPLADFYNASIKSWAGALIDHLTITSDCQIELYYTTDPAAITNSASTSWVRAKLITSGKDITETPMVSVEGRFLAGMVKLYANTAATASPAVRSFTFRAYPGVGDVIIDLPVVCADIIERPGYRPQKVRGLGDRIYASLKSTQGSYVETEVFRPAHLLRGTVIAIGARVQEITSRGAVTDVALVRVRGREVTVTEPTLIATGTNGLLLSSTDGVTWTSQVNPLSATLLGTTWADSIGRWVTVGGTVADSLGPIISSNDGINWSPHLTGNTFGFTCVEWSPALRLFVAGGPDATWTSPDGATWTARTVNVLYNDPYTVAWSPTLSKFVAPSNGSAYIAYSSDGITWSATSVASELWRKAIWVPSLAKFVVLANSGNIYTSANGTSWTNPVPTTGLANAGLAWSPALGLLCAVGEGGAIATNTNTSASWSTPTSPTSHDLTAVIWSASLALFIAVGASGEIITSADGVTWTHRSTGSSTNLTSIGARS